MPTLLLHSKNTNPQPQYYPNTQQPITDMTSTFAFAHVVGVIILTSKQNPTWHGIIVDSTRNTLDEKENTEGMTP